MSRWRIVAGVAILVILAGAVVLLAPAYYRNFQLGQYLEHVVASGETTEMSEQALRERVAEEARRLGIDLDPERIRVDRAGGRLRIEARYVVRVDVPIYTVDLHFRVGSGAR